MNNAPKRYSPNIFSVCVDNLDTDSTSIRLFHCYSDTALVFSELGGLLFHIDRMFDSICFPQASTEIRSFTRKPVEKCLVPDKHRDEADVLAQRGKLATFHVHVQFRQSSTWQGYVSWVEGKKSRRFKSELELLKLIDSAL